MNRVASSYAAQISPQDIIAKLREDQDIAIQDGLDTGSLTADEAKAARKSQDAIDTKVDKAAADGTLSLKELRDIQQAIRQGGQEVYTLSHNKAVLQKTPEQVLKSIRESQEALIAKGVESGAITPAEAKRLRLTQDALAKREDKAKADGTISLAEMQTIQLARKAAARDIQTLSRNAAITAKTPSDSLNALRKAQEAEIAAGVAAGDITPAEAKLLNKSQAAIIKMEEKARADGKVSTKELQLIKNARDSQTQQIYTLGSNKAVVTKTSQSSSTLNLQV